MRRQPAGPNAKGFETPIRIRIGFDSVGRIASVGEAIEWIWRLPEPEKTEFAEALVALRRADMTPGPSEVDVARSAFLSALAGRVVSD